MKLLVLGNHTCGNRGDSAIMRGLVDSLYRFEPDVEMDIMSRFPISSSWLQGRDIIPDPLYLIHKKQNKKGGLSGKISKMYHKYIQPNVLISTITNKGILKKLHLDKEFIEFSEKLKSYDAIIQVGGSNYVDLYGLTHFDYPLCAFIAKKPIYMVGHSVGPFRNKLFNYLANFAFSRTNMLVLRESISRELMAEKGIDTSRVSQGVDTAWLVTPVMDETINDYGMKHWLSIISEKKTIAITLRDLEPFDKSLGTTQQAYEKAIADVINKLIKDGYQVLALSTCTSIDCYNRDDRIIALRVKELVDEGENYHVVMDEFNDLQIGNLLSQCELTIGTRLHSAIISMNFNTPAIAINYEHKSAGIMQQLGLSEMAVDIKKLLNGTILQTIDSTLNNLPEIITLTENAVKTERENGVRMMKDIIEKIKEDLNK